MLKAGDQEISLKFKFEEGSDIEKSFTMYVSE